MLNNRELASVIILGIAIVGACSIPDARRSLPGVIKAVLAPKLALLWAGYVVCLLSTGYGLREIGLRYSGADKDAVLWAFVVGLPIYTKFDAVRRDHGLLARTVHDAVRLTAVAEFVINLYVFPLWVELTMQVALIVVLMLLAVPERFLPSIAGLHRSLRRLLTASGLLLLGTASLHLAASWNGINWEETALSFVQPVILTVVVVAGTGVVAVVSAYEWAFVGLQFPRTSTPACLRHRLALLIGLHVRLNRIASLDETTAAQLKEAQSFAAALSVVRQYSRLGGDLQWDALPAEA